MKIVLDTNVLIAALIARGACHELLEHCVLRHYLITSDFILNETHQKLIEKFGYAADLANEAVICFSREWNWLFRPSLSSESAAIRMTTISWRLRQAATAIAS